MTRRVWRSTKPRAFFDTSRLGNCSARSANMKHWAPSSRSRNLQSPPLPPQLGRVSTTAKAALAADHYNVGQQAAGSGKARGRPEHSYRRALALAPNDAEAWSNLGCTLWKLERLAEAESCLMRAVALRPNLPRRTTISAAYSKRSGDSRKPAALSKRNRPRYARPEPYCNLGAVLHRLGRFEEAKAEYVRALALTPDFAEAWSNLGAAFQARGNYRCRDLPAARDGTQPEKSAGP